LLARFSDSAPRPPVFRVPLGVKDILHCDGFIKRCRSDLPPELFKGSEAEAVSRLKAAGALSLGKTATTISGSATGVATDFFKYAMGIQTIGPIIRPAAFFGISGFNPSLGKIDTASWTVDL